MFTAFVKVNGQLRRWYEPLAPPNVISDHIPDLAGVFHADHPSSGDPDSPIDVETHHALVALVSPARVRAAFHGGRTYAHPAGAGSRAITLRVVNGTLWRNPFEMRPDQRPGSRITTARAAWLRASAHVSPSGYTACVGLRAAAPARW